MKIMKNMFKYDKEIFNKLFYGLLFGCLSTNKVNVAQYADNRVDMFYFSFLRYLDKFENDIDGETIYSLTERSESWFEYWENPGVIFEYSDIVYSGTLLYPREHAGNEMFDTFDKIGEDFVKTEIDVVISCITSYYEGKKEEYMLRPISFKPDKNINFLFDYLRKQWKDFKENKYNIDK